MNVPVGEEPKTALGYRDFRLFLAIRFFWLAAAQMQSVAVGWYVFDVTRDPLALGYVGLAVFVPTMGFALIAGHVADRMDRRRLLLLAGSAQAICSLALFVISRYRELGVWPVYVVMALIGTARTFSGPAGAALVPSLVAPKHFANAVAWSSSTWQIATISGPALGGFVYGITGSSSAVFATCFGSFLVSLGFILAIRPPRFEPSTDPPSFKQLFAGLAYVFERKVILGAISLDLFAVLLGGSVALLPVYAREILHVGPEGLGVLRAAPSVGAAVMALYLAQRPLRRRAGTVMFLAVAVFGLATITFGVSRSFLLSLGALTVLGAADMISIIVRQTVIQMATPDAMRGRVSAVNLVFIGASNELGEFESGITAALFGTVRAVVIGGVGTLLVVGVWATMFPDLRRVDSLEKAL